MKNIAVIPNPLRDVGLVETKKLIEYLTGFDCLISISEELSAEICKLFPAVLDKIKFISQDALFTHADFAITLGGDGTIIEVAVDAAKHSVPIMGINVGTLGFLTQSERGDYTAVRDMLEGNYKLTECMMLDITVIDENGCEAASAIALNDLIISGDEYKMITVSAYVNGTDMGRYSADGLIISSAIGSTAYSLSAGGAVMHPEVDAMIITPICPHTLKARSTVIPGGSVIEIRQEAPYRTEAVVRADGKIIYKFKNSGERIQIKRSEYTTRLVKQEDANFFDVLRNKLSD